MVELYSVAKLLVLQRVEQKHQQADCLPHHQDTHLLFPEHTFPQSGECESHGFRLVEAGHCPRYGKRRVRRKKHTTERAGRRTLRRRRGWRLGDPPPMEQPKRAKKDYNIPLALAAGTHPIGSGADTTTEVVANAGWSGLCPVLMFLIRDHLFSRLFCHKNSLQKPSCSFRGTSSAEIRPEPPPATPLLFIALPNLYQFDYAMCLSFALSGFGFAPISDISGTCSHGSAEPRKWLAN